MKPDIKLKKKSGIYRLRNNIDGKVYIGRTKCFYNRCYQYLYDFKTRHLGHLNEYLYRAMSKHGINNFTFEVIEYCPVENTPERELHWILSSNSIDRLKGYNIRLDVNGSMVTSPETSKKISSRLKKEWNAGLRDGHSEKLKASWSNRDRQFQSSIMSKALTKYEYSIDNMIVVNYRTLREIGLKNVISVFYDKDSDIVRHKGHLIERRKVSNG